MLCNINEIFMEDWQNQLNASLKTAIDFERYFKLKNSERKGIELINKQGGIPIMVTPHYLSLINPKDPNDPLRKQVIPGISEFIFDSYELQDPLLEETNRKTPNLIHRYQDRVLLLVTDRCASYCRFCTRKRWTGQGPSPRKEDFELAIDYIRKNTDIKEIIISGGDSLILSDNRLDLLLCSIKTISSIEVIRLATRMLTFAPTRFTNTLLKILKKYKPIYILSHINHPNEIHVKTEISIAKLIDNGFPILNQTVLLKGINDNLNTLEELFRKLNRLRVRPYYLHQCDLTKGNSSFRVPIQKAMSLALKLRRNMSGLCQPTFVVDLPKGLGKVPLFPNLIQKSNFPDKILIKGLNGKSTFYPKH